MYEIVADPAVTPYTAPVDRPTVPIAVLLLVHAPPLKPSLKLLVNPAHIWVEPLIAPGVALIVTACVAVQPVGEVYVITVVPAVRPVKTPPELTVPTAGVLLAHVPPVVASLNVIVFPAHTAVRPLIAGVLHKMVTV